MHLGQLGQGGAPNSRRLFGGTTSPGDGRCLFGKVVVEATHLRSTWCSFFRRKYLQRAPPELGAGYVRCIAGMAASLGCEGSWGSLHLRQAREG
ncbi:Uncharacterized protein M6B38_215065 [Iris pallida]|uniref:Uncharacterized protein n=1 Tax=Iris pallida TaxID=29817 RepID=A0AAX6E1N4_IRIPA|nr:Uncharacterized protein M6B38_215065 [Iris pallida]